MGFDQGAGHLKLTIASRRSRLALWQAEHVRARLSAEPLSHQVEILGLSTRGDEVLDRSLQQIGGKALFTKELEHALLDRRAELAVHSLKDVPMQLPPEFELAAILPREDPRDALVSRSGALLEELPDGAVVGTSSLRRAAQLAERYPRLRIMPSRGNLDTRLAKLDNGDFDALVLAAAGLKRLGLIDRIRMILPPEHMLPAVGQGALAIEVLSARADLMALMRRLNDPATHTAVGVERAVSARLGGSCRLPLAVYCVVEPTGMWLRALVASNDGRRVLRAQASGAGTDPSAAAVLIDQVCAELLAQGARDLLAAALE